MYLGDESKGVVLTCAQPTGKLHLGNYFGAIQNWVTYLDDYSCLFGVVDLHAITMPYKPADLRKNTLDCVAQYIACGLDPKKCSIFIQSHIHGLAELAWVLGCLTPLGMLQRMTQFKDKSVKQGQSVGAGLLYYPVLQAADILLYNADIVPVGEDQKQHIELTRDIAEKFNFTFSETFTLPEPKIPEHGARIKSLQYPKRKMSKSDENQAGVVYLWDEPEVIRRKILSAVTDSGTDIVASEDKPGVTNLLSILSLSTGESIASLEKGFVGKGYGDFKKSVAEAVIERLAPLQKKYKELSADKDYLLSVVKEGADVAQKQAHKTLAKVYRKSGFVERVR